jgi:thiol-disulfide isomerase/thioredoxin
MKRNIFYGFVILLLLGISALGLAYSKNRQSAITQNATSNTQQVTPPTATDPKSPGAYVDYSENAIADAEGTILLFFHAPWCPQCRQLDADIQKNGVPDGITIIKVDYDSNQDLRKKYGVTLQTTIVRVDENGEFISKYVAYNEPTLDSVITNMLMQ